MAIDVRNMEDVVVTALGICKRSRGLGYSATNVKPEELTVTALLIRSMRSREKSRELTSPVLAPVLPDLRKSAFADNQQ